MCKDANDRYRRYRGETKFRDLLSDIHYVPLAVYLYRKLESGSEADSAYRNDYYFFKRIAQ